MKVSAINLSFVPCWSHSVLDRAFAAYICLIAPRVTLYDQILEERSDGAPTQPDKWANSPFVRLGRRHTKLRAETGYGVP